MKPNGKRTFQKKHLSIPQAVVSCFLKPDNKVVTAARIKKADVKL